MANTYTLIASNTLTSSAASVTFSAIPNTYTDLVLKTSVRSAASSTRESLRIRLDGDTGTNYSNTYIYTDLRGPSVVSFRQTSGDYLVLPYAGNGNTSTSNTFASAELYIPNYAGSTNKPMSTFSASEGNYSSTFDAIITANAQLWRNTSAIDTILIYSDSGSNFVSGSSFFLYGIKNS